MKSKKSILSIVLASAMATTCAVAISQLSFNDESATKGVYPATFTAFAESVGQTDTLSTAWLVSNDDNYTLFATAFKVGEGKTYTDIGYTVIKPDGAFYMFVKSLEEDAYKFYERAKKFELLLVPSDDFGCPGFVRIAYCVDTDLIERSLPAFKELFEDYKND